VISILAILHELYFKLGTTNAVW